MREPEPVVAVVFGLRPYRASKHDQVPPGPPKSSSAPTAAADDVAPRTTEDPPRAGDSPQGGCDRHHPPRHVAKEKSASTSSAPSPALSRSTGPYGNVIRATSAPIAEVDLDGRARAGSQLRRPPALRRTFRGAPASTQAPLGGEVCDVRGSNAVRFPRGSLEEGPRNELAVEIPLASQHGGGCRRRRHDDQGDNPPQQARATPEKHANDSIPQFHAGQVSGQGRMNADRPEHNPSADLRDTRRLRSAPLTLPSRARQGRL